jgi:AbrB family looped-hinge helix DNA binding protein
MMFVLKVSPKGQITLPKKLREKLKVKNLIEVDVRESEGIIKKPAASVRDMAGCFKKYATDTKNMNIEKAIKKARDIVAHEIAKKNN